MEKTASNGMRNKEKRHRIALTAIFFYFLTYLRENKGPLMQFMGWYNHKE
jgi:hypothetical protein